MEKLSDKDSAVGLVSVMDDLIRDLCSGEASWGVSVRCIYPLCMDNADMIRFLGVAMNRSNYGVNL